MIGRTVTHYRILEELGGGMGVVYKAEDTRLGRQVALKFLSEELSRDSDAIQRFQREARAASSLNHPNICTIYEFDEHEGRQFIVMEMMEGRTLKDRIEGQPLPTEEIVALAGQITEGLAAAHQRGIIHRDIKPANLFVAENGLVKVLDFGVAKLLPREEDATLTGTQTAGGATLGTLAYMAPEQLNREKVDARTDIYALGCVLYEMATGQRPFATEFGAQRVASILSRTPEPPSKLNPEVPAWLDAIILKCLEKEPGRRYQSAKELQGDLRGLAAPVTAAERPAAGAAGLNSLRRRWWVAGGVAVVLLFGVLLGLDVGGWRTRLFGGAGPPKIDSLAVLPLKNLMGDPDQDYFVEGMHEALTAELSKISALKVISRTSTMQYKGVKKPAPQIAQELGVAGLIEGSVLREGDQVRITVQLIHGPSDRHLWAQSFDRELRGILALHSEVAREIARQIKVTLAPAEETRLARTPPVDPEAYRLYLLGRYHWNKLTPEGLQKAIGYFQQAIDKDPAYALAYAGLADTYNSLAAFNVLPPHEVMPRAKAAAVKALEIDNRLAEAHASLGWASYTYDRDWPTAGKHFERALALNPAYPVAHRSYSFYLGALGRPEEALAEAKRARDLDPVSPASNHTIEVALYLARQFDQAIEQCRKTQEMDPSFLYTYWVMGDAYAAKGMYREALAKYEKFLALSPSGPLALASTGYGRALLGERSQALWVLDELRATSKQRFVPAVYFALVYVGLGEKDQAFTWLEKAYEERTNFLAYLKVQATWDPLRDDPRFQALLRRMNFPEN